jgi:hypothetical protein
MLEPDAAGRHPVDDEGRVNNGERNWETGNYLTCETASASYGFRRRRNS